MKFFDFRIPKYRYGSFCNYFPMKKSVFLLIFLTMLPDQYT